MGIGTPRFDAGHPILLTGRLVIEIARDTAAFQALQRSASVVDASPSLRESDPADPAGNAINIPAFALDVHEASTFTPRKLISLHGSEK